MKILIVGDGPGGLSAALFLAKMGVEVDVFGKDETPMHKAMLYNYLGIPEMTGPEFQRVSREQVSKFGATLHDVKITEVQHNDGSFAVQTETGERHEGTHLILACGPKKQFAEALGLKAGEEGNIHVERNGQTEIKGLYAIGWTTRANKIQAIISAGDGATAALEILSEKVGKGVHDFDFMD